MVHLHRFNWATVFLFTFPSFPFSWCAELPKLVIQPDAAKTAIENASKPVANTNNASKPVSKS